MYIFYVYITLDTFKLDPINTSLFNNEEPETFNVDCPETFKLDTFIIY